MVEVVSVDPKFRLHFKDRNVAFANGFAELFKNENQCDLIFVVQGKEIKAHRHILSFVSKTLNELFVGCSIFDPIKVDWEGGDYEISKNVLHYIFNGLVKVKQSDLKAFVETAQFMDIGTSLQDLNLDKILAGNYHTHEIIYDCCGKEIVEGFQKFYEEEKFFDTTLVFEGKELQAHRHVLSALSPYFDRMFSVCSMEHPLRLLMDETPNVTYELMQNILHYIYFGEVTVDDLVPLLNAGETLEISSLKGDADLEANRPNEDKANAFDVYASSKKNTRTIQPITLKADRPKVLKLVKSRRRRVVEESDSEGSVYDPASDNDNNRKVLRRRNPMATGAKPKTGPNTRGQKPVQKKAINSFAKTKPSKVPAQMNKARAIPNQTRSTSESRRGKPANARQVKTNSIAKSEEFCDQGNEKHDQDEGAADEVVSTTLKRKRGDRNNNQHEFGSRSINQPENDSMFVNYDDDFSQDGEFKQEDYEYEPDGYEYGSDDGAVGGLSESYGDNVYVEDLTIDQPNQGELSNNATYAESDDVKMQENESNVTSEPKPSGRRGQGKNTQPLDHSEYIEAKFVITPRGSSTLSHGGYRYSKSQHRSNDIRWKCNQSGGNCRRGNCNTYAFTIEVGGKTMVKLPPNDKHNHDPLYLSDSE